MPDRLDDELAHQKERLHHAKARLTDSVPAEMRQHYRNEIGAATQEIDRLLRRAGKAYKPGEYRYVRT